MSVSPRRSGRRRACSLPFLSRYDSTSDATGVRVMNLDEDTKVVAAARVPVSEDDELDDDAEGDAPEVVDEAADVTEERGESPDGD